MAQNRKTEAYYTPDKILDRDSRGGRDSSPASTAALVEGVFSGEAITVAPLNHTANFYVEYTQNDESLISATMTWDGVGLDHDPVTAGGIDPKTLSYIFDTTTLASSTYNVVFHVLTSTGTKIYNFPPTEFGEAA